MIKKFIIVALLATATPVLAADPAATAAATALVEQLGIKAQIADGMNRGIANMRSGAAITQLLSQQPGFDAARAKQPAKFDEVLKKIGVMQANAAQKVVNEQLPAVVSAAIQSYATNYTVAELKGLSDFYRSPLGIALQTKQPKVAADINAATGRLMGAKIQAAMQALGPQIDTELKRLQPPAAAGGLPPKK
jgi:hypothetical protein